MQAPKIKKIGIMQPYLFPHLAYFQLMGAVDEYVIYDDVKFIKGGWINRNNIAVGAQKVMFTIQLKNASSNKAIKEIYISDSFEKFLKTISMAYVKAPYFKDALSLLEKIILYENRELSKFTANSFEVLAKYMGIRTNFIFSSDLQKDNSLRGQSKVIAICNELNADVYVNAIGGQELYDDKAFKSNGIKLTFLKSDNLEYKQLKKEFIPGLSIIDVLMFNSPTEIRKMLNAYELI